MNERISASTERKSASIAALEARFGKISWAAEIRCENDSESRILERVDDAKTAHGIARTVAQ